MDEVEKISASMGDLLWLLFSGGEIFVRKDLPDLVDAFYRNNHPVIITLPTNGLAPDLIVPGYRGDPRATAPRAPSSARSPLDGIGDEHDRMRNTPGSFDKAMETYERLRQLGERYENLQLGINTVFCRENQDNMDEIIDFVNTLPGCETHTISMVRGNPADDSLQGDRPGEIPARRHAAGRGLERRQLKDVPFHSGPAEDGPGPGAAAPHL